MGSNHTPSTHEEILARSIVDCACIVHTALGPGLLEAVYEHCFCRELQKHNIPYARQVAVPVVYDGEKLPWNARLDVVVDNKIVCELKSLELPSPVFLAQILTRLKLVDLHMGFLINFNVSLIKEGIRRVIR